MKKSIFLVFTVLFLIACKSPERSVKIVKGDNYELKITDPQKAVLVLFPCYPCDIANTKTEAKFLKDIEKAGITTLLLNYNLKLFLTDSEKTEYAKTLNSILDQNKVAKDNVYIGGFSGGGNIALLLTDYMLKTKNQTQPKGLMVIDSPIDLEALYNESQKEVIKNVDAEAVAEGQYLMELFDNTLGKPNENIEKYKALSPYLVSCNSTQNIRSLKDIKTRFYSEPDLEWQNTHKKRTYQDLNAYKLEQAILSLKQLGSTQAEFIATKNRGYRANGDRHPHSWNIVEQQDLIKWITE
ncbi:alpha/beta hydrolase fold domain-containing protein [Flavobacterium cerinum]|uniref:Alpha/beta hydrolase fold domain-containing protein n=1 Tax=Flavobacterium cerinum TaxID=2502784 RepID=A0ABY5IRS9_9FLAO|nr:alpha/beta hydrolase fold domain-containing protein [Flavobacterium cerinum]UUC44074.1 alpha/beta hydrolase fold domain-containing protein [Flavobacterium cerinum]